MRALSLSHYPTSKYTWGKGCSSECQRNIRKHTDHVMKSLTPSLTAAWHKNERRPLKSRISPTLPGNVGASSVALYLQRHPPLTLTIKMKHFHWSWVFFTPEMVLSGSSALATVFFIGPGQWLKVFYILSWNLPFSLSNGHLWRKIKCKWENILRGRPDGACENLE